MLLPIVTLVVAIGVIVLIVRGAGLFPRASQPETTGTTATQGASTVAVVSSGAATATPTGATSKSQGMSTAVTTAGRNTATAPALNETANVTPTEPSTQPSSQSAPPGKIVFSDQGATITDPIYMELVRVPAREFLMGSDPTDDPSAGDFEKPQHRVSLAEYFIGKYEVTNEQYAGFVKANGHPTPDHWENGVVPTGREDHPAVNVSWDDGVAFAAWLSRETGEAFRLPSEAEWEMACRGPSGYIYPWGDRAPDAGKLNYSFYVRDTTAAGSYMPAGDSPYGAVDILGNASEWVADWYDISYYATSPAKDPHGPESGNVRVLRGGSFSTLAGHVRCTLRFHGYPDFRSGSIGFRVVLVSP